MICSYERRKRNLRDQKKTYFLIAFPFRGEMNGIEVNLMKKKTQTERQHSIYRGWLYFT